MSLKEIIPQLLLDLEYENYNKVLSTTSNLLQIDRPRNNDGSSTNYNDQIESANLKQSIQQIHCRTLIALSKYNALLDYFKDLENDEGSKSRLLLEYVYALYKLGRYGYCRDIIVTKLDILQNQLGSGNRKNNEDEEGSDVDEFVIKNQINGMMHILAQCQYRLHETKEARETYTKMLLQQDGSIDSCVDDIRDEILTNALAASISNKTFVGGVNNGKGSTKTSIPSNNNVIDDQVLDKLRDIDLNGDDDDNNINSNDDTQYELVYNAATQLMLQSTSVTQTKKAMEWLQIAEQKCIREYEDDLEELEMTFDNEEENDGDDDGDDDASNQKEMEEIQKNKQQALDDLNKTHSKNIMPIQANIAFAKMQLGDINGATRSYLELVLAMKKITDVDSSFNGGGALLAVDTNLAVLNSKRSSSASIFDLMKRLPDVSHLDSKGKGNNVMTNRITPSQIRTLLYNRAVLYQKMNKNSECKSMLVMLKNSLETSNNNANEKVQQNVHLNGSNGLSSKKKRKKGKNTSNDISNGSQVRGAPVESVSERTLWESRIALLEGECNVIKEGADNSEDSNIKNVTAIVERIKSEIQSSEIESETYMLEYTLAEVLLYQTQKSCNGHDPNAEIDVEGQTKLASALESLPESIRSRPAVVATLYSIYCNLSMDDKVKQTLDSMKSNGDSSQNLTEQKRVGDFKLRLGMYQEAATIYESILSQIENGNDSLDDDEIMECQAGLMKAMSYFDLDKAIDFADEVPLEFDDLDGEELEAMEIPRLSKGTSGSKMRKMIGRNRNSSEKQKKKKNHDAILRRRAKKREAYLEKLQQEGKYNPDRPVKPDPERWVPKSQRSYNKRGRRGRTKFVGAQGIGSGAGADKDAAKLDAAARAAAKALGKENGDQSRSTAHLAVSSNGFKAGRRR